MLHKSTYIILSQFFFFEDLFFRNTESINEPFRFLTTCDCLNSLICSGCSDINIFDGRFWLEMHVKETTIFDEYEYVIPGFGKIRTEAEMTEKYSHPDEYFKALQIDYNKLKSPFIPNLGPLSFNPKSVCFIKRKTYRKIRDILKGRGHLFGLIDDKDQSLSHIPIKVGNDLNFNIKVCNRRNQIDILNKKFFIVPKLRIYLYPYGLCASHVILNIAASEKYNTSDLIRLLKILFHSKLEGGNACNKSDDIVCSIGKLYSGDINKINDFIGKYVSKILLIKKSPASMKKLPQNMTTCLNFEMDKNSNQKTIEKELIGILNKDLEFKNYNNSFLSSYSSFYGKFSGDFTISTDTNLVLSFDKHWMVEKKRKTRIIFYWILSNIFYYNAIQKYLNKHFSEKIQIILKDSNVDINHGVSENFNRIKSWFDGHENECSKLTSWQRKIFHRIVERLHVDNTRIILARTLDQFQKNKDRVLTDLFTKNIYAQFNDNSNIEGRKNIEKRIVSLNIEELKKNIFRNAKSENILKASSDLIDFIIKIDKIGKVDPEAAIGKARKVTEIMISNLYKKNIRNKLKPLFNMIDELNNNGLLPRKINTYFNTVRIVGNLSVHYQPDKIEEITLSDVKVITIITAIIVEWYTLLG